MRLILVQRVCTEVGTSDWGRETRDGVEQRSRSKIKPCLWSCINQGDNQTPGSGWNHPWRMLTKNDWPATGLGKTLSLINWLWDRQLEKSVQNYHGDPIMEVARGLQRLWHYLRPESRDLSWGLRGTGATALKAAVAGKPGAGPAKGSEAGMGMTGLSIPSSTAALFFFFLPYKC